MICKGVETRSHSFFNSFEGILLKVVDLEVFSLSSSFFIFSTDTFSNEKEPMFPFKDRIFWIPGCLENLNNI